MLSTAGIKMTSLIHSEGTITGIEMLRESIFQYNHPEGDPTNDWLNWAALRALDDPGYGYQPYWPILDGYKYPKQVALWVASGAWTFAMMADEFARRSFEYTGD